MLKNFLIGILMVIIMVGGAYAQERCFTFTGNVRADHDNNSANGEYTIVASMGTSWISQTPFYQYGVTGGMAVSYDICVNEDHLSANIQSSSIFPVGGASHPLGYVKPDGPYNSIHYDTGTVLLGDETEYVQIQFDPANNSTSWSINDTFTIVHSAHILNNPLPFVYNGNSYYDWVSRIYIDGWISEATPPPCGPGTNDTDCDGVPNDTDPCPDQPGDCGPMPIAYLPELGCEGIGDESCQGRYSLAQMGYFDNDGTWIWNQDFINLTDQWYSNPNTFPELWTPIKESGLVKDGPWQNTDYRLDRRTYSDGREFTMLNLLLQTGESVKYPTAYLSQDENTQWVSVWLGPMNWPDVGICTDTENPNPHANCDGTLNEPDGDPWNDVSPDNVVVCCRPFGDAMAYPWIDSLNTNELTEDRINFVRWENTGEIEYAPQSYDGGIFTMINYDLSARMWKFANETAYSQNAPTLRYHFPTMISAVGEQTFTINYDEGTEGKLTILATDVRAMPVIPVISNEIHFTKVKDNGKLKERVKEVNHIILKVREVVDPLNPDAGKALVIQWPEPDAALFGGMQLRVYVGYTFETVGEDDFLFLDAPVQAGTVVFPQDIWESYKARMLNDGKTDVNITLMYRVRGDHYQNRSNSPVTFQISE